MFIENYGDMKIGNFQQYLISSFQNLLYSQLIPERGRESAYIFCIIAQRVGYCDKKNTLDNPGRFKNFGGQRR